MVHIARDIATYITGLAFSAGPGPSGIVNRVSTEGLVNDSTVHISSDFELSLICYGRLTIYIANSVVNRDSHPNSFV